MDDSRIPSGIVTFLFTDVEGSTRLWAAAPDDMAASLRVHDEVLRRVIESYGGYVFTTAGDSFCVAFDRASSAVACAKELQDSLKVTEWPGPTLRVRMGLHLGEADERDGDYFGPTVNLAARVESAGHGGQVLVTEAVRAASTIDKESVLNLGDHELRDVGAAVRLFQLGTEEYPPLRTPEALAISLPSVRSTLVGRSAEVIELRALISEHRVVSIVGVGGCGKTRLAVEVASQEAAKRAGVFFVDLAKTSSEGSVISRVLADLGLPSTPDPLGAVTDFLAGRDVLIVMDNCEHVIDAAAALVGDIVDALPEVRLLATSRESLAIDGERAWKIPSLEIGPSSSAVQLFVERAVPGACRSPSDLEAAEEICARLDGLPLAIELAAARTRTMPVPEVRDHLDDRFRLLGQAQRGATSRQGTLAAALAWSFDLLTPDERSMLRRLSVFAGGFDLGDVAATASFEDRLAQELVDSLVSKSLVEVVREGGRTGRRKLLESVRLLAQQELVDVGDAKLTRDAHARLLLARLGSAPISKTRAGNHHEWMMSNGANLAAGVRWLVDNDFRGAAVMTARSWQVFVRDGSAQFAADLLAGSAAEVDAFSAEDAAVVLLAEVCLADALSRMDVYLELGVRARAILADGSLNDIPDLGLPLTVAATITASITGRLGVEAAEELLDGRMGDLVQLARGIAHNARAVGYMNMGDVPASIDATLEMLRFHTRSVLHPMAAIHALRLLKTAKDDVRAAEVFDGFRRTHDPLYPVIRAFFHVRAEEARDAVADLAEAAVNDRRRRVDNRDGLYLSAFAFHRAAIGHRERARAIFDHSWENGFYSLFPLYSDLCGWKAGDWEKNCSQWSVMTAIEGEPARRIENHPQLLAEEIEFWSSR